MCAFGRGEKEVIFIKNKKIWIVILICTLLFSICLPFDSSNISYATTNQTTYSIATNRGPRMSFGLSNSKKVSINLKDGNGISAVKIEKYSNSSWNDISSKVTISKDMEKIEISSEIIADTIKLRITSTDNSDLKNYSKDVIEIVKLSKANSSGNYFILNLSPRINLVTLPCLEKSNIDSLVIKAVDGNTVKKYSITDLNNNDKCYTETISDKQKTNYITYKLKNLKKKDSMYKIIVKVTDNNEHTHTEKLMFYIREGTNQTKVNYIAHKGASKVAPENTTKAFELAGQAGVFGIETDIQSTKDGCLVCMHDSTVDKTTDGKGKVSDITLKNIKKLKIDYGNNVEKYNNLTVPTFEEYLDICKKYSCFAIVELKRNLTEESVKKAVKTIKDKNMQDKCIIISFNYTSLSNKAILHDMGVDYITTNRVDI